MNHPRKRLILAGGLLAALFGFTGCQSLPDLQPFADSTAQLAASVRTSGKATVADMHTLVVRYNDDAKKAEGNDVEKIRQSAASLQKSADDLEKAWNANVKMLEATVAYADSLAQIAAAGKAGADSAKQVGTSLKTLLNSVGTVVPGGDAALELGGRIYGQIAEVMAAKDLEKALAAAQPAVDEVARVLAANLASLAKANHNLTFELTTTNEDATRAGFNVSSERRLLKLALAAHDQLRLDVQEALNAPIPDSANSDLHEEALKKREARLKILAARNLQLEEIIAVSRAKLAPVDAAVGAAEEKGAMQSRLLAAAQAAIEEWAAYHRRLLAGLHEKRAPSVEGLNATATDVRDFLNLIRKKP